MTKSFVPSPQQAAFFDFVSNGRGSCFLEAVAGAGKTTTLVHALQLTSGTLNFAAYNTKIADEIKAKVAPLGLGNRVRVGTFHSFGFGAWRYVAKNVKAGPEAAREKFDMTVEHLQIPRALQGFVGRLVSLAKQGAMTIAQSQDAHRFHQIIEHHDLAYEIEDEKLITEGVELAQAALQYHADVAYDIIDFDDMIWLPVISGCKVWQNDWVFVDEAQDTNPARRALARKMLKNRGRAVFVGDRHQAIYGFTGADSDAIDLITREFNCVSLPLTTTYRCPKAVVAEAQTIVSHIQAHESAPQGEVLNIDEDAFWKLAPTLHPVRDAILCRNTKPLVKTAYALIKSGIGAHVEGREIGQGLLKLVDRFDTKSSYDFRDRLLAFMEKECTKLIAKGKETQAQSLQDRVETILVIMDANPACQTVQQVRDRINQLFQDGDRESKPTVTLATVHKSKGREWERVFLLGENAYMPSPYARQAWQLEQEHNLQYVAYTRAKASLVKIAVEA